MGKNDTGERSTRAARRDGAESSGADVHLRRGEVAIHRPLLLARGYCGGTLGVRKIGREERRRHDGTVTVGRCDGAPQRHDVLRCWRAIAREVQRE